MDAQTSAAQRYTTDSTEWASRANTMQQNVSSLEQKNTAYQKQMDSFRTASETYQKRWDNLQSTYTQQNTSTEQLHQQIHTAIDQYVEASNVEAKNGKVYVNLPEKMLFASSNSTTLSSKGKQALDKLAEVLAANENVEVDIVASAAYYSDGTTSAMATAGRNDMNAVTDKKTDDNAATNKPETENKDVADNTSPATANVGDSAYPRSGAVTNSKENQDPAQKSTAQKSAAQKSSAKKNTATAKASSQGDKSVSFKSSPKKSTKAKATKAPSWNMNVARSTAIVRQLTENGLPQARIILTGQGGKGITTNEWAATNRGYQVILSPKMDSYYQMMQEGQGQGQGTTSMK
jgi:outer membrane protein OmpA-like peptidoglycan-associated protein